MTSCASETEFYGIFAEVKKKLINDVILTLVRASKEEINLLEDTPEEFVKLALDTCDK